MSRIIPHPDRYDGHFKYQFTDKKDSTGFSLGGLAVNKTQALARLGVMPHNNVLTNKVINALGQRTLDILRAAQDENRPRVNNDFICQTVADEAELLGNWAMIELLSAIKPLELKDKQSTLNVKLKDYFKNHLGVSEFSAELDRKLGTILNNAKNKMDKFNKDNLNQYNTMHRDLLRTMMNDFEELQADISLQQRGIRNLFSIANDTNTSATQKAYYAIQNHIYSAEKMTSDQLWAPTTQSELPSEFELDTANYPGIRQDNALFAACLIENMGAKEENEPIAKIIAQAKDEDAKARELIYQKQTALKIKIDEARGGIFGALGLFRDAAVAQAMAPQELKIKNGWTNWDRFINFINPLHISDSEKLKNIKETISSAASQEAQAAQIPVAAFSTAKAAYVYKPGDLMSAIASVSYEFSEYFSREMAAKHPGPMTVGFVIPATYLPLIALSSMGIAPHMMHIVHTMSKVLSADGHLINPDKITQAFTEVDKVWLGVTKAHGALETFFMTAFGAPKIIYLVTEQANAILTGVPETTIKAMAQLFSTGELDTNLSSDDLRNIVKTGLKTVLLLGAASALGIGVAMLPHTIAGAAVAKHAVETFDNVQASTFVALTQHTGSAEAYAIAQLLAEIKTAGLCLGKIMGVSHFLRHGHEQEDAAAIAYFQQIKNGTIAFDKNSDEFKKHKAVLEANLAENPDTKLLFANDADESIAFLNEKEVCEYKQPPAIFTKLVAAGKIIGGSLLTLLSGIPGMIYYGYRSLVHSDDVVPDTTLGRYFYKNGAKLMLNTLKFATSAWYGVKSIGQAVTGFIARVGSGLWEAGKTIVTTPVEIVRRANSNNGNALKYTLSQGAKVLTVAAKILEFAAKAVIVAASPLLAVGALVVSLINSVTIRNGVGENTKKGVGENMKEMFETSWKALSTPTEKLKDYTINFDKNDTFKKNNAESNTTSIETTTHWFIRAKNTIGSVLSTIRDNTIRRLEHNLQSVVMKENDAGNPPAASTPNTSAAAIGSSEETQHEPSALSTESEKQQSTSSPSHHSQLSTSPSSNSVRKAAGGGAVTRTMLLASQGLFAASSSKNASQPLSNGDEKRSVSTLSM